MGAKTISVKELILDSKSTNLYGYTILIAIGIAVVTFLLKSPSSGVVYVVLITLFALLLNFLLRFYIARNHSLTRQRIEAAATDDEAFNIVCGGLVWGLSAFCVVGLVFYAALRVFVL